MGLARSDEICSEKADWAHSNLWSLGGRHRRRRGPGVLAGVHHPEQQVGKVSVFTVSAQMPLGVALLFAAVSGVLLAGIVASLRILQLRHRMHQSK